MNPAVKTPRIRWGLLKKVAQELVRPWYVSQGLRRWVHSRRGVRFEDAAMVYIGIDVRLDAGTPELLQIGRHVHIEEGAKVLGHLRLPGDRAIIRAATVIGDNVYIGLHAVIGPGVTVGSGAYIHANSVVLADVPPGASVEGFHDGSKTGQLP